MLKAEAPASSQQYFKNKVIILVSLGGCYFVPGYDRGEGRGRNEGHDRDGGHDKGGGHEERR